MIQEFVFCIQLYILEVIVSIMSQVSYIFTSEVPMYLLFILFDT